MQCGHNPLLTCLWVASGQQVYYSPLNECLPPPCDLYFFESLDEETQTCTRLVRNGHADSRCAQPPPQSVTRRRPCPLWRQTPSYVTVGVLFLSLFTGLELFFYCAHKRMGDTTIARRHTRRSRCVGRAWMCAIGAPFSAHLTLHTSNLQPWTKVMFANPVGMPDCASTRTHTFTLGFCMSLLTTHCCLPRPVPLYAHTHTAYSTPSTRHCKRMNVDSSTSMNTWNDGC